MKIDLHGKNILVTGSSRGIGRAIAIELAKCGAHVGIHYAHDKDAAEYTLKQVGNKGTLFKADLADGMQVNELFNQAEQKFKRIDVLINNAGIAIKSDPEGNEISFMDDWLKTMDVNLNAVGLLCKKAINHFSKNGGGRIINISSRAAFRGDTSEYLAYAASKGGIVSLTRSIARAYGKENIVAFNVAPGFVTTDMAMEFVHTYGEAYIKDDIALPEITKPEDVSPMVAFLASGLADHSTGGTFDINAGSYVH